MTLGAQRALGAHSSSVPPRPSTTGLRQLVGSRMFRGEITQFADLALLWGGTPRFRLAVGINAHVVNLARADHRFSWNLQQADVYYADGQSVVWGARLAGAGVAERIATTDLAPLVLERAAAEGRRVYFLGGEPGIAELAADFMRVRFAGVQIRSHHGFLDDEETRAVVEDILRWRTELLFVGLGDPLQVEWVVRNRAALGPMSVLTCGGLFDWLSERNHRAPGWMIDSGLEWLHRLRIEPRRLWRRYVLGNPRFVAHALLTAGPVRSRRPTSQGARLHARPVQTLSRGWVVDLDLRESEDADHYP